MIFLDLPNEIICEVVKYVDYNGLLVLRKACPFIKNVVDQVCNMDVIRRICVDDMSGRAIPSVNIMIDYRKPPLFLLQCNHLITVSRINEIQVLYVDADTKDDLVRNLHQISLVIQRCPIDFVHLDLCTDKHNVMLSTFLERLSVKKRTLNTYTIQPNDWDMAIEIARILRMDTVIISSEISEENVLCMADIVESIIISLNSAFFIADKAVSFALKIFAKRCSYLRMHGSNLSLDGVNILIQEIPKLGRKLQLLAATRRDVTPRSLHTDSFTLEIKSEKIVNQLELTMT